MYQDKIAITRLFKGRIIRKLMGGGGEVQKKNSRKGLIQKNFLARQLTLRNIHARA